MYFPIFPQNRRNIFFEERAPASQSLSLNANRFETTLLLPRVRTVGNDRCAVSNDDEEEDQGKTRGIRSPDSDSKDARYFWGVLQLFLALYLPDFG